MELFSTRTPTTILAGAGLSAAAPTCLPGWVALNDAVLRALGDALERVTLPRTRSSRSTLPSAAGRKRS